MVYALFASLRTSTYTDMASIISSSIHDLTSFFHKLSPPTATAAAIWFTFWGFLVICYYLVPGRKEKGVKLKDGSQLTYRINGFTSFILLLAFFYGGVYPGWWKPTVVYDNFWPLFTVANLFSFAQVIFLYIKGTFFGKPDSTGSVFWDIWYGVELNPRLLDFDFKYFAYRPLIMGWALLILSIVHHQYAVYGVVSTPMLLYLIFTWTYTIDYLWLEQKICTTWDIIAEKFGFGLVWGDHVFYPFFYSIQAHYLIEPYGLHPLAIVGIIIVFFTGYTIFRGANNQKDEFKRIGTKAKIWGKPAQTTKDGRLLISGWWGIGRHINYCGDICMAIGWTLPCGFSSLIPWLHSLFFIPFLMHREYRDECRMREKYGETYKEYCKIAKWRIFPFLY